MCGIPSVQLWGGFLIRRNVTKTVPILTAQSLHSPWLLLVVFSLPFDFLEMCHSWARPPYVQVCHCMWFCWPFLCVSTASSKHWSEKASTYCHLFSKVILRTCLLLIFILCFHFSVHRVYMVTRCWSQAWILALPKYKSDLLIGCGRYILCETQYKLDLKTHGKYVPC